MYYHLIPMPFVIAAIVLYTRARQANDLRRVAIIQPLGSVLITLVALLSLLTPNANFTLTAWIVAGLILSVVGDINNVDMEDEKTVFIGLVIFLFAYLAYAIGLTVVNGFHRGDLLIGAALLVAYAGIIVYLWPGLGEMRVPVSVYALVMSFLLWRALSTFFDGVFNPVQSSLLSVGAGALYVGDLEYGIHRFRRPEMPARFGPVLYLGGQLLIALSLSYF